MMKARFEIRLLSIVVFLFGLVVVAGMGEAQTVLERTRLGNNTEDMSFVGKGPLANHIVMMDGCDVMAFPGQGRGRARARTLFDVCETGITSTPRSIAYIDSERHFAFVEPNRVTTLIITDHRGNLVEEREMVMASDFVPQYPEGLAYLPEDAPLFPDHLVMAAMNYNYADSVRLLVMRPDGQVVHEIVIQDPGAISYYITSVGYLAPDRLLISSTTDHFWTVDFAGVLDPDPVAVPGVFSLEGLVQLRSGEVVAAGYAAGNLFFFDEQLDRLARRDRDYSVGIGISRFGGLAWDDGRQEYLIATFLPVDSVPNPLVAVAGSLDTYRVVMDPQAAGYAQVRDLAFLPGEDLVALLNRRLPAAVALVDSTGTVVDEVDLSWLGRVDGVAYLAETDELVVSRWADGSQDTLWVVGRDGALHREIHLAPQLDVLLSRLTQFEGGLAAMASNQRLLIMDLDGNVEQQIDALVDLGVVASYGLTSVSSGPLAPALAIGSGDTSELVLLRVD